MSNYSHLFITDQRMLSLMDFCVSNNVKGIGTITEWCKTIRFSPTNLDNVRKGLRGFSKEHLAAAGHAFDVDMNYLFGLSTAMFRKNVIKQSPLDRLKQAVMDVEHELEGAKANKALKQKLKQN